MIYRNLGSTGLRVSQLGFGAMRLPMLGEGDQRRVDLDVAVPMIHRAFESGVNYIDTAVFYCNGDSQKALGVALKGWRDKVVVSTKNHYKGEDEAEWTKLFEDSLEFLQIDCIDVYNIHGITWKQYQENYEPRVSKWFQRAKDQGLIKHICCSFHDNNEALVNIVDTGAFESITLQYNMLDRQLEEGIAHAHSKGMGVVVMGPVGGGRLGANSKALHGVIPGIERVPELALRFVMSNPNVTMALSGMSTMEQVEENLRIAQDPVSLSNEDRSAIDEHLKRLRAMADLYCSGCGYCMPCPTGIPISKMFELYNRARVYDLWDNARKEYLAIGTNDWHPGVPADACAECGACEEKCPQRLPIMAQLKEVHAALGKHEE